METATVTELSFEEKLQQACLSRQSGQATIVMYFDSGREVGNVPLEQVDWIREKFAQVGFRTEVFASTPEDEWGAKIREQLTNKGFSKITRHTGTLWSAADHMARSRVIVVNECVLSIYRVDERCVLAEELKGCPLLWDDTTPAWKY